MMHLPRRVPRTAAIRRRNRIDRGGRPSAGWETGRHALHVEALETRTLLSFEPSAAETLLAYLVNETRRAPVAAATRLSVFLPEGQRGPFAPLVIDHALSEASRLHSEDMLAYGYMSHYGRDGSSPSQRATAAGYQTASVSENVYRSDSTGPFANTPEQFVVAMNDGWFKSDGHRANMLSPDVTEFGGGVAIRLSPAGSTRGTELFGSYESGPFLTGVVFDDANANRRFNVQEGVGGVTITASGPAGTFTATTMSAGGWSLKVPAGEYVVRASGGSYLGSSTVPVVVGTANVQIDFISGVSTGWVDFSQHINVAPVLEATPATLPPIILDTPSTTGVPVESLLGSRLTDADPLSLRGIAVTSAEATSLGVWQYSTDAGRTWSEVGRPTPSAALLLRSHDLVRLSPRASQTGSAGIAFRGWDRTTGEPGAIADTGSGGGSSAFSTATVAATCQIIRSNTAPTLASGGGGSLGSMREDTAVPRGVPAWQILGTSFADADPGTLPGLAITGLTGLDHGTWNFSLDGGSTWTTLNSVTDATAVPLRGSDLLGFTPAADFVGEAEIAYRGWDQSTGQPGTAVDLTIPSSVGGRSAYSIRQASATIVVTNVNDAPAYVSGRSSLRLRPVGANTSLQQALSVGTRVSDLLGNSVQDRDATAVSGIAIIGVREGDVWWNGGSGGYSSSPPSPMFAMLLRDTDFIYFAPRGGFTGTGTLTFRLWDQTSGNRGNSGADISKADQSTGGTTAFGSEILTASVFVGPAGTAPSALFGSPTRLAGDAAAVQSIPVTFTEDVSGLDVGDFRLTRDGVAVPLDAALLDGSGNSFTLKNLGTATAAAGAYSLTLATGQSGITDSTGNAIAAAPVAAFSVTVPQPPPTVPAAPSGLIATPGNATAQLSWASPITNGGAAVTDYAVEYSTDGGMSWTAFSDGVSPATAATVSGLSNGVAHVFRVAARNSVGTSSFSTPSSPVSPFVAATVPAAPSGLIATPGNATVRLSWVAPPVASAQTRPTSYMISYSRDGGANWSSLRVPATRQYYAVSRLANGVAYVFRVAAANRQGTGAFSAASPPVTPATVPSAPPRPMLTAVAGQLSIGLLPPALDGGSPVDRYVIQYRPVNSRAWQTIVQPVSGSNQAVVSGLRGGATYWVRARAGNAVGMGGFSGPSSAFVPGNAASSGR